ncbi:uncharacterized protein BX664DRAFT_254275 [Halteromyces radiatus]|uniref:uncharacterized protein n=1 Tax=Halteromyces radiatus TaxID=101107 RepID=UPI0022203FB5|nr:uncharacterized protein BX664DRAFT_254275 [Halteromyces radiatus]KAI8099352.1 hypothetical protein BX664DRAFT_254275 [Halteromyces radiatus]
MDNVEDQVVEPLTPEQQAQKEKHDWINQLRLKFCIRPEFEVTKNIIHPDGRLNQDYFRPPKNYKAEAARKWTDVEKELLIQGIAKHGIGNFGLISKESMPKWSTNDLRVKCIRLIGRQNLQLYRGWKGNAEDIAREYERNKAIGLKFGTWKQGVLVYDDEGNVEKEILATEPDNRNINNSSSDTGGNDGDNNDDDDDDDDEDDDDDDVEMEQQ